MEDRRCGRKLAGARKKTGIAMARRKWSESVTLARIAIAATLFFGPFGRAFALTTLGTSRGWWMQPTRGWRPFTILSLVLAAAAAVLWPYLAPGLFESLIQGAIGSDLAYVTVCYIAWSLALVPHNVVRILVLIRERRNATKQGRLGEGL
jgi:hypothetical protein